MKAYLILKPAGGAAKEELPTAANIKSRLASEETVRKAEEAARKLGFKVVSTTPIQVTIEGPKEQFEKAFSSRLTSAGKRGKRGAAKKPERKSQETVMEIELYRWDSVPQVPAELAAAVEEIVLPQAAALH
jgi:subtilase family serine protease